MVAVGSVVNNIVVVTVAVVVAAEMTHSFHWHFFFWEEEGVEQVYLELAMNMTCDVVLVASHFVVYFAMYFPWLDQSFVR